MRGTRTAAAAIITIAGLAAASSLLTACGAVPTPVATTATAALGAKISAVSLTQVRRDIAALYQRAPGIAAFTVSDVKYTAATLDKVLGVCASGAAASDEEALQSDKIMACAPLIYFFYSYGAQHPASGALGVASDLYNYAVTTITGPVSTQQTLNKLLRSWGLPVTSKTSAPLALSGTARLEATLVADARAAMNASHGVRINVTSTTSRPQQVQHASFDSGTSSAAETLTDGSAVGYLRVTPVAAYFSGNPAGLAEFFGLPKKAAARIGSRWVSTNADTSQYASLSAGSLIASIPATILPTSDDVAVTSIIAHGIPVYRLTWKSFADNASTPITETLDLRATGDHTPIAETSTSARASQTATFTNWGPSPTVAAPPNTIPFTTATIG